MKNKTLVALLLVVAMVLAGAAAFADTEPITATEVSDPYEIAGKTYYDVTVSGKVYKGCIIHNIYPATCSADAYTEYLAEDADKEYNILITLVEKDSKLKHIAENKAKYTHEKNAAPTHTTAGWKGYDYCPACKEVVNKGEEVPMIEHTYDEVATIIEVPGFFSKGVKVYFCECGEYDPTRVEDVLPDIGYNYVVAFVTNMYKIITNLMYSDWIIL